MPLFLGAQLNRWQNMSGQDILASVFFSSSFISFMVWIWRRETSLLSERPCIQTWRHIQSFFRDRGFYGLFKGSQGLSSSLLLLKGLSLSLFLSLSPIYFIRKMLCTCRTERVSLLLVLLHFHWGRPPFYSLFVSLLSLQVFLFFLSCSGPMSCQNNRVWINPLTISEAR